MGSNIFPAASSGGLQTKQQTFTSSGTWTVPTGVNSVKVTCIGAAAGFGGAGAVTKSIVDTSAIQGTGITVTVGAAPAINTIGSGGSTSFGSYATAGGGFPGDSVTVPYSGTTFISGRTVPAQPTVRTWAASTGSSESRMSGVVYNPVGAFYMTTPYVSASGVSTGYTYYTSTDGITWTRRNGVTGPWISQSSVGFRIYYANGRTFLLNYNNTQIEYIASTADGITWVASNVAWNSGSTVNNEMYDWIYSTTSGLYYGVGQNSSNTAIGIFSHTSANILAGTTSPTSAFTGTTATLRCGNRFLFNGSNLGLIFYTNTTGSLLQYSLFNGTTWAAAATSTVGSFTNYPTGGCWDGTKFIITLLDGSIYTSTNGTTWTATGTTVAGLVIAGYSSTYYYGFINNFFAYSTNGTTWTTTSWNWSTSSGIYTASNTGYFTGNLNGSKMLGPVWFRSGPAYSVTNYFQSNLLGTFDMASPNTTIALGFSGDYANNTLVPGGAGGRPVIGIGTIVNNAMTLDAPGVDGYGVATYDPAPPITYGSTNYYAGNSGAVILEWVA